MKRLILLTGAVKPPAKCLQRLSFDAEYYILQADYAFRNLDTGVGLYWVADEVYNPAKNDVLQKPAISMPLAPEEIDIEEPIRARLGMRNTMLPQQPAAVLRDYCILTPPEDGEKLEISVFMDLDMPASLDVPPPPGPRVLKLIEYKPSEEDGSVIRMNVIQYPDGKATIEVAGVTKSQQAFSTVSDFFTIHRPSAIFSLVIDGDSAISYHEGVQMTNATYIVELKEGLNSVSFFEVSEHIRDMTASLKRISIEKFR